MLLGKLETGEKKQLDDPQSDAGTAAFDATVTAAKAGHEVCVKYYSCTEETPLYWVATGIWLEIHLHLMSVLM